MRFALLLAVVLTCTVLIIYFDPRQSVSQDSSTPRGSRAQLRDQVSPECQPFIGYESCAVGMAYDVARILSSGLACDLDVERTMRVTQVLMLKMKVVAKSEQDLQRAIEGMKRYGEVLSRTTKPSAATCEALRTFLGELSRTWKLDVGR